VQAKQPLRIEKQEQDLTKTIHFPTRYKKQIKMGVTKIFEVKKKGSKQQIMQI